MTHLRALAASAAVGLAVAVTPGAYAQPGVDQRPPGPADPTSPGALVVPDGAKDQLNEMRKRENPEKTMRGREPASESDGRARSRSRGDEDRSAPIDR